jgi:hypothetical protein
MALIHLKKFFPNRVMSQRDVEGLIRIRDELFETVSRRNQPVDWKDVKRLVAKTLWRKGVEIATDDEFEDDDTPSDQESSNEEDDEDSKEENISVVAATDASRATSNAVAAPPRGTSLEVLSTAAATAPLPPGGTANQAHSTTAAIAPPPPGGTANAHSTTAATAPPPPANLMASTTAAARATLPPSESSTKVRDAGTAASLHGASTKVGHTAVTDVAKIPADDSSKKPLAQSTCTTAANPNVDDTGKED